ncbi:uncharacterized protein LOC106648688 [Trichogramma pretiosum]|uniref:uncharacterized protein LOC106648688 n=1 Tax=Trichogramma pretiosum TaxID=7493 RepID=UPI000C719E9B|nr:uncharacterized protein LOC106648688 [Trichogramma pretiosum]
MKLVHCVIFFLFCVFCAFQASNAVINREELTIKGVYSWKDPKLPSDMRNWEVITHFESIYLAGFNDTSLDLYRLDIYTDTLSHVDKISITENITALKLAVVHKKDITEDHNQIILILSVKSHDNGQDLKWFYLKNDTIVPLVVEYLANLKNIQHYQYLDFENQHKFITARNDSITGKVDLSIIEIYDVIFDGDSVIFRYCFQFRIPEIVNIKIYNTNEGKVRIILITKNHVILQEYKHEDMEKCNLKLGEKIIITGSIDAIYFESGHKHYVASWGNTTEMFELNNIGWQPVVSMDKLFSVIQPVEHIYSLPIDTYRDEVLLIVYSKLFGMIILGWQGTEFKQILSQFDVEKRDRSNVIILPKFGIKVNRTLIKINIQLNSTFQNNLFDDLKKQDVLNEKINAFFETELWEIPISQDSNSMSYLQANEIWNYFDDFGISFGFRNISIINFKQKYDQSINISVEIEQNLNKAENKWISETLEYSYLDFREHFQIKGSLIVENLFVKNLNDLPYQSLLGSCMESKNHKIVGRKSFPILQLKNQDMIIERINGLPLKNMKFVNSESYHVSRVEKISRFQINGNLNLSTLMKTNWSSIINNLVFINQPKIIPGKTQILRGTSIEALDTVYLNGRVYPSEYIFKSFPEIAIIQGSKSFQTLRVLNLEGVYTINEIDADDFVILNSDQSLNYTIFFENLTVDVSLVIHGNITGLPEHDINPDLTILNSNQVDSDVMFNFLNVSGHVYVKENLNGTRWNSLDDLLLKSQNNSIIHGKKTFTNNVYFSKSLAIKNHIINNHSVQDFITLDTEQNLPNLVKIFGNIYFNEVSYVDCEKFEKRLVQIVNNGLCIDKPIVFADTPMVENFSFLSLNGNFKNSEFNEKMFSVTNHMKFYNVKVHKLYVNNLESKFINGINLKKFSSERISRSRTQNISSFLFLNELKVDVLKVNLLNNITPRNFFNKIKNMKSLIDNIYGNNSQVDKMYVDGNVYVTYINNKSLHDFDLNNTKNYTVQGDSFIEQLIVGDLINGLNVSKLLEFKTKEFQFISHFIPSKKIHKMKCHNLIVEYLNEHSTNDVINCNKNQTLAGPITINGRTWVKSIHDTTHNLEKFLSDRSAELVAKLDTNLYKLTGNFFIDDDTLIDYLDVFGKIQNKNIYEFAEDLIPSSANSVNITGSKIFNNVVFGNNITIVKKLNEINLEHFYQNVVFIERPFLLKSKLEFAEDLQLDSDFVVIDYLQVLTLKSINISGLMVNAVYKNDPSTIQGIVFQDVVFQSNLFIESWNDVHVDKFFLLKNSYVRKNMTLLCKDASVVNLKVVGKVNGENVTDLYEKTFMISKNQNITGNMFFLNNSYLRKNLNSHFINNVNIEKLIVLNSTDAWIGNYAFRNSITTEKNINIFGKLNGVNLNYWLSNVINKNSITPQSVYGDWTVYGNVNLLTPIFNASNIKELLVYNFNSKKQMISKNVCQTMEKIKTAVRTSFLKFKSFDYLLIQKFDYKIYNFYKFEFKSSNYILVNFETRRATIFIITDKNLIFVNDESMFGLVKKFITFNIDDILYIVTYEETHSRKGFGNVWSFDTKILKHMVHLGNISDITKIGVDSILIRTDAKVQKLLIKSVLQKMYDGVTVTVTEEKDMRFFFIENRTIFLSENIIYEFFPSMAVVRNEHFNNNYVSIYGNNFKTPRLLQIIHSNHPNFITLLNFEGDTESLLLFLENQKKIQIYKYKGINGFKYHSSIKIKVNKMSSFKLKSKQNSIEKQYLAVVQDYKLIILEAKMYGENISIDCQPHCDC